MDTLVHLQKSPFLIGLCRNGAPVNLQYDNSSELFRISTFALFPTAAVTERTLARAGWFYTGVGDRVQCFRCNVTAEGWQTGDCPTERHRQLSPSCAFIQSLPSTANLLSSSHSAFSPLCYAHVIPVSGPGPAPLPVSDPMSCEQPSVPPPSGPLSSREVEDMSHQRPPTCHNPSMRREQDRLDSFHSWILSIITPSELAKAGFYYLGQGDRVACFTCGGQLSNWEPGDRAVSEHQRHYPNCHFVRGDRADNVSMAGGARGVGVPPGPPGLSNVSNPAMQQREERLLTFVHWPLRIPVRPDQLAKAGFYYVGRNDDVKCFCCDGGLRCWESGDDPWVEHAKWFPRCQYLLQEKGQEFVHQIQARFPRLFEQLLTNGDSISREFVDPPMVNLGPGEERSEDAVMMNTPVVVSALEMGFERGLVKQTVQSKILTIGENYKTVQELVSDLLSAEDQKREEEKEMLTEEMASDGNSFLKRHQAALVLRLKSVESVLEHLREQNVISGEEYSGLQGQSSQQQTARLIDLVLTKGNAAAEVFRNWIQKNDVYLLRDLMAQANEASSPSQDLSDLPMEEQLRRLQEERTCKVCMDKEVNIVFIPCGHLVVCKECAPSLRKCPICRGLVKGTVRTFLS
ncbi:baculoviral IAP repeat-containing protein 2 isoform X1 [Oncorhynchus kisutch]|uniref:RING-type E3 ubiquitin transferase n=1 Tax=Oncorhynchus kisutch TaxID=8019 RepID=A0A8C7I1B4_ONCKI|nr:baculoviral IAP repeat-containing protein 2 isoform X1 [Oncorhynchus kisutch]XP_031664656.1 baculoviral IAP repeat-containing protein 2 isoform X1 [Oncorhynchus kisutch]